MQPLVLRYLVCGGRETGKYSTLRGNVARQSNFPSVQ